MLKKQLTITAIFIMMISIPMAFAGKPELPQAFLSNTVNPYLTLDKIRLWEKSDKPEEQQKLLNSTKQKIFWSGIVTGYRVVDGYVLMKIKIGRDTIDAVAEQCVRNLDYDRTGYRIAFKGAIVLNRNNKFYFADIWSVILLEKPKTGKSYTYDDKYYSFIYEWIEMHNPHYTSGQTKEIADSIISSSRVYKLDPRLVTALLTVESAMDTGAVSGSGAVGLGQIMPATADWLGVNNKDIKDNIKGCCKYLSSLINSWEQSSDKIGLGLASYNAGPGNVKKYGGIPPFSETKNYVLFIKFLYKDICKQTDK